jgi:c-di-GMP-binding flagellar brake protein YcgR
MSANTAPNRRTSERMEIEREVQYRILNSKTSEPAVSGKTLNMSSSGVLFTTDQVLYPGRRLELSINWPAQLNSKCALKLVARGRVVRFEDGRAALEILQHEFRTRALTAGEQI